VCACIDAVNVQGCVKEAQSRKEENRFDWLILGAPPLAKAPLMSLRTWNAQVHQSCTALVCCSCPADTRTSNPCPAWIRNTVLLSSPREQHAQTAFFYRRHFLDESKNYPSMDTLEHLSFGCTHVTHKRNSQQTCAHFHIIDFLAEQYARNLPPSHPYLLSLCLTD
jgi:hypothetical protein